MKCTIQGIKPRDYTNKQGRPVKGYELYMLADNPDVFGKVPKDCFVASDSPLYLKNLDIFEDLNQLQGREVNAEWDVETYGSKQVKRLINFEFLPDFYDLVKREPAKKEKASL